MSERPLVRQATVEDAGACVAIYCPFVEHTAITFETEVPNSAEMATPVTNARETHEWLVLEHSGTVIGYAYAHAFSPRSAYQWSTETSIYIASGHHRTGGGRKLYTQLLQRLSDRGYRRALAGITQPNMPAMPSINRLALGPPAYIAASGGNMGAGTMSPGCRLTSSMRQRKTIHQYPPSDR